MDKRRVGKSGLSVSAIGLGCNNFGLTIDAAASKTIIHRALDLGVTLFDTAPIYGSEWGASESILNDSLGSRRKDAVLVTKFGVSPGGIGRDNSRSTVIDSLDESLQRLGTDYIDLYMLHWPDDATPTQETLRALDDVVTSGKVRYIGCCNLAAWRVVQSVWTSRSNHLHEYVVTQDEYSLAQRAAEQDLLPALQAHDMGLMPYAPLANGLLTGKYSAAAKAPAGSRLGTNLWNTGDRYLTAEKLALVGKLSQFAERHGHSLLELAVSWLLAQPAVCSVISGARTLEQLEQNTAAGNWKLTADELDQIDEICRDTDNAD